MSDADCTPGHEPHSVAASFHFLLQQLECGVFCYAFLWVYLSTNNVKLTQFKSDITPNNDRHVKIIQTSEVDIKQWIQMQPRIIVTENKQWYKHSQTRMWADAQRDGCPSKYRWRPLFNTAKFGWRPLLKCRAVTLPIRETLSLIHIWRCRRSTLCRSRWSPYH